MEVGAGPSGLILALTLLMSGINVRIIDKDPEFHVGQRGVGIQVILHVGHDSLKADHGCA